MLQQTKAAIACRWGAGEGLGDGDADGEVAAGAEGVGWAGGVDEGVVEVQAASATPRPTSSAAVRLPRAVT